MTVDAAMKLVRVLFLLPVLSLTLQVIAAVGTRVAAWGLSGNDKDSWRVHSTLVLPDGAAVTALASRSGLSSSPFPKVPLTFLRTSRRWLPEWLVYLYPHS